MKNNTGDRNSGYRNSGYRNSGAWNSGDLNSGDWNSGDWNSGYRNSGDWNSGAFNTDEPTVRMFNKETNLHWEDITFPNYMYFDLTDWVDELDMTDQEKKEHPEYKTTGGYLKVYDYKEAWKKAWNGASQEEREATKKLPNFSWDVFTAITGIKQEEKQVNINSSEVSLNEIIINGVLYKKA